MYHYHKYEDDVSKLEYISLKNAKNSLELCPQYGAAISNLKLNNKPIIKNPEAIDSPHIYASSILFPFVNRIENGRYTYNGIDYQLSKNENTKLNAIHGLVYNQTFKIESYTLKDEKASITLSYTSKSTEFEGFPFQFKIQLKYTLRKNTLLLKVTVENCDTNAFPFSLGWHPYFFTKNYDNRQLFFASTSRLKTNETLIPYGFEEQSVSELLINRPYDDCYKLDNDKVVFDTEDYKLQLNSNSKTNYLQLYTPQNPELLAIEYMTAPANCFNSNIDVLVLQPKEIFSTTWTIKLIS